MNAPGQRRRLRRLTGPAGRLVLLALAVAAAWGGWALRPYRPLTAWEAPCESVVRIELSADGTRLLAVGNTGAVDNVTADSYRLWDAATGRELAAAFERPGVEDCRFSPDGHRVVARMLDGTVTVRAATDGRDQTTDFRLPPEAEVGPDRPTDPAVSPDGRLLATLEGPGQTSLLWEDWARRLGLPRSGRRLKSYVRLTDRHTGADLGRVPALPQGIGFAPDGRSVWTYDQTADPASGEVWLHVRQSAVPPPRPPAWLWGMTALAVVLAAADYRRSRRPAGSGGAPR